MKFIHFLIPVILFACLSPFQGIAQDTETGSFEIVQDQRIDYLLLHQKLQHEDDNTYLGYRIQIFFGSGHRSKANAYEVREEFVEKFPDQSVYVTFKEPYYRVRVGDFRTRMEAEGLLERIRKDYPNAFAIQENINPPRL